MLIVVVIAAIGVFIVTRLVAGSLQERFNNQLVDSARAASSSIVEIEQQRLAVLRLMAFTDGVAEAVTEDRPEDLDAWLRPVAANHVVDDLIIYDHEGRGLLRLLRVDPYSLEYQSLPAPDMAAWQGVQNTLNASETDSDKFIDIVGDYPANTLYFSAPIADSDGNRAGGIAIGVRVPLFVQNVSSQSLSAVALYTPDGRLFGSSFRAIDPALLALTPGQARTLSDDVSHTSPVTQLDLAGTPYQIMYTSFEMRGDQVGLLAVGLPVNYIVERISTSRNTFGVLFSALFIAVGMLGVLLARSIVLPVHRLVDTTRAIRTGDLSKRVGLHTPDELGELATSFDHMTDQLVERNQEIEGLYFQQIEETARREAVLTSIGDAVIVQDPTGNMALHNEAATRMLQVFRRDANLYARFSQLIRNPAALAQPKTVGLGEQFFSVLATPVTLPDRATLGHVIVFRDVTALVSAERLKDDMINQMSHELRTPLTAARGYIDLLRVVEESRLSNQGQGYAEGAFNHLTVLEHMINQVIDVSAIISARFSIKVERFNLASVLRDLESVWRPVARQRELDFTLVLPSEEMWIEGDRSRLTQVFDHLIRNAHSYTLAGGEVQVYGMVHTRRAVIHVTDSGVGIPLDELDKVFERLYRGSSASAGPTDSRGLGLGLYLSRYIVEAHGGHIFLESKIGFGTILTVELPVQQS